MTLATLAVLLVSFGDPAEADPVALVARLGAPKFADRQDAGAAIRDLGLDALHALESARESDDAEIRLRAEGLLEALERAKMLGPTLVRLEELDGLRTAEAVRELADQTGYLIRIGTALDPTRKVGPFEPNQGRGVPLWEAIDRLGLDVEAIDGASNPHGNGGSATHLLLVDRDDRTGPTWREGPFRLAVRDTHFESRVRPDLPPARPGRRLREERAEIPATPPRLELSLELLAEPKLSILPEPRLTVTEARDDLGQPLSVESVGTSVWRPTNRGIPSESEASSSLPMTVSLRLPEQPGRSLARFRGRIEMEVEGRRRDPIEVALPGPGNDAPARLETDRMRLVVHDLTRMPGGRQWLLDLTIQPRDWPDQLGGRLILRGRRGFVTPSLGRMLEGVEFADTAGHPIQPIGARTMMVAPSGIRVVLDLPSSDVGLPPARLLYRDSLRETIELEFSLEPIPFVRD